MQFYASRGWGESTRLVAPRLGLWTPWAEVTCALHYVDGRNRPRDGAPRDWAQIEPGRLLRMVTEPVEHIEEWCAVTQCDECLHPIVVRGDVARLWNLAQAIGQFADTRAHMMQTGGMCAALCVKLEMADPATGGDPPGMRYLMATAEDDIWMFLSHRHPDEWHDSDGADAGMVVARQVDDAIAVEIAAALAHEGVARKGDRDVV